MVLKRKKGQRTLVTLFLSVLYISTFTFGGGFVIVTLMKRKFVDELHWIGEEEMLDLIALAQSSPGAIAVNAAMLVGKRIAGYPGLAVALAGTILPPIVILSVVSMAYEAFSTNPYVAAALKGMQAGVGAVIAGVVVDLGKKEIGSVFHLMIMIMAFVVSVIFKVNAVWVILGAALAGLLEGFIRGKKEVSR